MAATAKARRQAASKQKKQAKKEQAAVAAGKTYTRKQAMKHKGEVAEPPPSTSTAPRPRTTRNSLKSSDGLNETELQDLAPVLASPKQRKRHAKVGVPSDNLAGAPPGSKDASPAEAAPLSQQEAPPPSDIARGFSTTPITPAPPSSSSTLLSGTRQLRATSVPASDRPTIAAKMETHHRSASVQPPAAPRSARAAAAKALMNLAGIDEEMEVDDTSGRSSLHIRQDIEEELATINEADELDDYHMDFDDFEDREEAEDHSAAQPGRKSAAHADDSESDHSDGRLEDSPEPEGRFAF